MQTYSKLPIGKPTSAKQRRDEARAHKRFMAKQGKDGAKQLSGLLKWAYSGRIEKMMPKGFLIYPSKLKPKRPK